MVLTPELKAANLEKCLIHSPDYMREGVLLPAEDLSCLLFYDSGRPCVAAWESEYLEPIPLNKQEHTITPHQFMTECDVAYVPLKGLYWLLAKFFLLSGKVSGPDSVWRLHQPGLAAIYDAKSGKLVCQY